MKIAALYIYPIKSGPAVALHSALAKPRGFANDRRFMVTRANGQFLTQRQVPALGRVELEFVDNALRLSADGVGEVDIVPPTIGTSVEVRVWGDVVQAQRMPDEVNEFYSEVVGAAAQLVYMPDESFRPTDAHEDVPLSFADGYPYLVLNTASLDALNARIDGEPVPLLAFRPNIVVEGAERWAEDDWTTLKTDDAVFELTTNCERCSITTLDPARPDRPRKDGEPLRTLAEFRRNEQGKVEFARNAIVRESAQVHVGHAIDVE